MAVVTYKPRIRNDPNCPELYPGDAVGHVGLDVAADESGLVTDSRLPTMMVTGYPYDFLKGQMATSGPCSQGMSIQMRLTRFSCQQLPYL